VLRSGSLQCFRYIKYLVGTSVGRYLGLTLLQSLKSPPFKQLHQLGPASSRINIENRCSVDYRQNILTASSVPLSNHWPSVTRPLKTAQPRPRCFEQSWRRACVYQNPSGFHLGRERPRGDGMNNLSIPTHVRRGTRLVAARDQNALQSNAFSQAAAAFNTVTSSYLRPTSMIPVGNLMSGLSEAGTNPHGSDNAGCPVPVPHQQLSSEGYCQGCLTVKRAGIMNYARS
jgi:hypothetical protein